MPVGEGEVIVSYMCTQFVILTLRSSCGISQVFFIVNFKNCNSVVTLIMPNVIIHWSLVVLIIFTILSLLLTFMLLWKLRQDTKYDLHRSKDGLTYILIDL